MTHNNKLVRDKIPEILDAKGVSYDVRTADTNEEYRSELLKKMREEFEEFSEAWAIEELADILEVIEALTALPEYSNVHALRLQKKEERGGFEKRLVVRGEK